MGPEIMNSQINKIEEKKDKNYTIKINYSNIKIKSKTFGEIELKYISVGDLEFFIKLLDMVEDDKEFAMMVIHHQLITPKVSFIELKKIPESEFIELVKDFVKHELYKFQYFKETTDTEFYTSFREAIKTYNQKQVERLQVALGPIIEPYVSGLLSCLGVTPGVPLG